MAGWGNYSGGGTIQMQQDYSEDQDKQPSSLATPQPPTSAYNHDPQPNYDDYNDDSYEEKKQTQPSWAQGGAYGGDSVAPAPQSMNSAYGGSTSAGRSDSEIQQKEYKLQIKEQKLNAREEELRRREAALATNGGDPGFRRNNWPSERFGFVYHNIKEEIPDVNKRMVYLAYYTWILTFFGYLFNWLIILIAMFAGLKKVWEFFVATLVVIIGVPASFLCWYKWGIYAASRTSGNFLTYGCFFLNFLVHFAWTCIMFVSIPVIAMFSAGILSMFDFFDEGGGIGNFLGITSLIAIVVWGIILLMSFWLFGVAVTAFRKVDLEGQATEMAAQGAVHVAKSKLNDRRQ